MERRDFLKTISTAYGLVLTPSVTAAFLSGCSPESGATLEFLTAQEAALVDSLCEGIIPTTDTPGARAAGVVRYVDMLLNDFSSPEERGEVRSALQQVQRQLEEQGATILDDLGADDQLAFLARMEADDGIFGQLKAWTVAGYYTSEIGATQELHVRPLGVLKTDIPLAEVGKAWA